MSAPPFFGGYANQYPESGGGLVFLALKRGSVWECGGRGRGREGMCHCFSECVRIFRIVNYESFQNNLRKTQFWGEKVLIRGMRVLGLVLRGADFAPQLIFRISCLFGFFKYVKSDTSPPDITNLAID